MIKKKKELNLKKNMEKEVYKQIGNSVCVPVVNRIAKKIIQSLKEVDYE